MFKHELNWQVKKFGGTSVGSVDRIRAVAERVAADFAKGERPVIVVSAMAGETNRLVELAYQLDPHSRGPAYDMLLASGEQVAVALVSMALDKMGMRAEPLLAFQLGIETDEVFSKARIQHIETSVIKAMLNEGRIPVIAGFQGVAKGSGKITTLGRGGSDTTAVALAAALGLPACEIYTDVAAIQTADPRLLANTRELDLLCFDEMMEMAALGSKVLHSRCVEIAAKFGVRIHLRSSFEDRSGTWVVPEEDLVEQPMVTAVTHVGSTTVFYVRPLPERVDFMASFFAEITRRQIVVDIISQSVETSEQRLAFSVDQPDAHSAHEVLKTMLPPTTEIRRLDNMAKVSAVGVGMRNHPGVAAQFFKSLADDQIPVHLVTTSEIKISAVIEQQRMLDAVRALHDGFGLGR